jgi:hypothetical protein
MARRVLLLTFLTFCILAVWAFPVAFTGVAGGERQPTPSPITVIEAQVTSVYPDYIDFQITAASSEAIINRAAFFRRVGTDGPFESTLVTSFAHAERTTINNRLVVGNYLFPPFTPITYYWRIRDLNDNELYTLPITVLFQDNTRPWHELDDGHVIVNWYDHPDGFGRELLAIAGDAYNRLVAFFGVAPPYKPRVVLLNSRADFDQFQSFGIEQPHVGGQYLPGYGLTLQLMEASYAHEWLQSVVPHELSHLISDAYYPAGAGLPLFLEEGLATYNEAVNRQSFLEQAQELARANSLLSLAELSDAVRSPDLDTTVIAYHESSTIFQFIVARWGAESLPAFLTAFRQPDISLEDALPATFGVDLPTFEREWMVWLGASLPTLTPRPAATATALPTRVVRRAEHTDALDMPVSTPLPCLGSPTLLGVPPPHGVLSRRAS